MPHPRYASEASAFGRRLFAFAGAGQARYYPPVFGHPQGKGGGPPYAAMRLSPVYLVLLPRERSSQMKRLFYHYLKNSHYRFIHKYLFSTSLKQYIALCIVNYY